MLRVLIADDEEGARSKVRRFLKNHEDCVCIGEACDGAEAKRFILEQEPDVVFLDISMPRLDGFQVLAEVPVHKQPLVIFATAFSDKAIQAFEVSALDYLLKPFDRERFDRALERARRQRQTPSQQHSMEQILKVLKHFGGGKPFPRQLLVQDEGLTHVVACSAITHIESAGNYALLHTPVKNYILRKTLSALEEELDPSEFCRVHRQFMVRLEAVVSLEPYHKGDMLICLKHGGPVKLSRRYKDHFLQRMSR